MDTNGIRKFAVVVLIVMLLVAGTIQTKPVLSQSVGASLVQNGRIAFYSYRGSSTNIYVMNIDGTGVINLTNSSEWNWDPAWSPDGKKIAFVSDRDGNFEIYMMNADGSGQTRLTNNSAYDRSPAWSPDGSKIAFMSVNGDLNREIYVMNVDGTGQTNLSNSYSYDSDPSWSPDGSRIAFTSDRESNPEIFVMNADGSGAANLTRHLDVDWNPSWSPDGRKIAFESFRDGNYEIYVMNVDGTSQIRLTNNPAQDSDPTWSPDSSRIAFMSKRDGNDEIYVMNADGTGVTRLTNNPANDEWPSWGPGEMVVPTPTPSPTPTLMPTPTLTPQPTLRAWTLMFYMAGDNGSDMDEIISWELVTLREASYNRNVNLVIFRDGVDSEANYEVLSDGKEVVTVPLGEVSTGDPSTLAGFVRWALQRYPAQHYALVIDDHGQGLAGVALDNHPSIGDWLGPKEMRQALAETGKVDIIYMNACLMANLESAYQLRGYADYYVAYESQGWGPHDFGSMVDGILDSTTAEQLALSMAETYFSEVGLPATVSVVRMSEVENVAAKTSALAGVLRSHFVDAGITLWNLTDASLLQRFDDDNPANGINNEDGLADLYRFAWLVESACPQQDIKTAAQGLMNALGNCVVRSWSRSGTVTTKNGRSYEWSHENAHGVSISCPRVVFCFYNYSWLDFAAGTKWPCPEVSVLSAADPVETIEWGPLMVDLVTTFNPDAPAIISPPEPIPLLQDVTEVYLPIVFSQR